MLVFIAHLHANSDWNFRDEGIMKGGSYPPQSPHGNMHVSAANAHCISAYALTSLVKDIIGCWVKDFCKTFYLYLGNLTGLANADQIIL